MAKAASRVTSELLSSDEFKFIIELSILKAIEKKMDTFHKLFDKLESRCSDLAKVLHDSLKQNLELKQKVINLEESQQKLLNSINNTEQYLDKVMSIFLALMRVKGKMQLELSRNWQKKNCD